MLVTITNETSGVINNLQEIEGATGGQRENALPYPFGHIGELAASASKQLPMHPQDLYYLESRNGSSQNSQEILTQMTQAGTISIAVADQTGVQAFDEKYFIEVG